jgi:hypothetical protein
MHPMVRQPEVLFLTALLPAFFLMLYELSIRHTKRTPKLFLGDYNEMGQFTPEKNRLFSKHRRENCPQPDENP